MRYDWSMKDWTVEDRLYAPKRKVNNRNSHQHPHIIGSFYSQKMERTVEYESLGERLFYYYLELDQSVMRYYVQPVEIPIQSGEEVWNHVPDTLVFRRNNIPFLYQVKHEPEEEQDERLERVNRYCEQYALNQDWTYVVIYPKTMPPVLSRNIRFLKNFIKERSYFSKWEEQVAYRLVCLESSTVQNLADSFSNEFHPLLIKPLVFHLIAKGVFQVDVDQVIGSSSIVTINQLMNPLIQEERKVLMGVH